MNILSLCDSISPFRLVIDPKYVTNYYATDTRPYEKKVALKHFPKTTYLSDDISKWDLPKIDLIVGTQRVLGSYTTLYQQTKRSLISERITHLDSVMSKVQPRWFWFETVIVKPRWRPTVKSILGVEPIRMRSFYFTPQQSFRRYYTNIPHDPMPPITKKRVLDYLEPVVDNRYVLAPVSKLIPDPVIDIRDSYATRIGYLKYGKHKLRVYYPNFAPSVSPTITKFNRLTLHFKVGDVIRHLTPLELERLQELPDNYTEGLIDKYRYYTCALIPTIPIIEHGLRHICKGVVQ